MLDSSIFSTSSKNTGKEPEKMLFKEGLVTVGIRAKETVAKASPLISLLRIDK